MSPQFIRAVFSILVVRAIFLSPVQGSEFGPSSRPSDSSLKRLEAIRPSRLRFTKPCPPSASLERLDCIDGGDDGDGDKRINPAETSVDAWTLVASSRSIFPARNPHGTSGCVYVRLRC